MKIKLDGFLCDICGYKWYKQYQDNPDYLPKRCANAKCKSRAWNKSQVLPDQPIVLVRVEVGSIPPLIDEMSENEQLIHDFHYIPDIVE